MAVTVASGKCMDAIVVDNKRTGMECIQYMREQVRVAESPHKQ
jgi:structural maintenance of chromosome 1